MSYSLVFAALALDKLAAFCAAAAVIGGALVGLIFRGAALAWREEKEAAVAKADRLEVKVEEQAGQIHALEAKVAVLERLTNFESYSARSANDHKQILDALMELTRGVHGNTTAVEFLIKQKTQGEIE